MPPEHVSIVPPMIGGGEMGRHVRDTDWSTTPLGAYSTWPQSLRSALSLVLNATGIAALYWGPQLWLLYNDAYGVALGDRHPWAFGRPMTEVLTDIAPVLGPQVAEVLRTGEGFAIENLPLVMRRHGRHEDTVWTYSFSPVQGETCAFAGVLLLATEVTQQKAVERSGSSIRMRLEIALRVARLGTFDWMASTGAIEVDARGREMFGLPAVGALTQDDTFGRIAPEDVDRVHRDAALVMGVEHSFDPRNLGRTIDFEYDVVHPDGSRRSIVSSGSILIEADGTRRMIGAFDDVTDLKRAEAQLRAQNATLERRFEERTAERNRIWETSRDMLLIADAAGVWRNVNPAWNECLGWTEAELLGRTSEWMEHPDDQARSRAEARKLSQGHTTSAFENRFRTRAGDYRTLAWTAVFSDGMIYAAARDVTDERAQTAALLAAEAALRQSQKMEAVGQLTGGLAHDFNNLLAGISGSLELMQTRMQQGRLNDVERYMAAAQGAAKRAAALTHRLLAFSRQQTLDPKPTDVNRLVAGLQEMIQRTVGPGIKLEVIGASGIWPALVDPSQLENALLNLCINARDAMPDGGHITIETANKWLDERAARSHDMPEGQYLCLSVTDTGTGMPPDVVARAFDPFFTTKPIGQGTGLGLSMIYGFAKQSGGQVRIYSEVDEGTTVSIYLPRHRGAVAQVEEHDAVAALPRSDQGETVLIVDDEPTVRMLVTDILEDLGYTAIEASDSAAGLKILQSDIRIDLLITDVGLPGGMNGRQMADAGRVSRPDLKVLFITGYAENAVVGNGHLMPGMAVLTKPFAMDTMAARIRSLIEAHKEEQRRL